VPVVPTGDVRRTAAGRAARGDWIRRAQMDKCALTAPFPGRSMAVRSGIPRSHRGSRSR